MWKTLICSLAVLLAASAPSSAGSPMKTLGEDPAGDGPPALDLTFLQAGVTGSDLEIRIGVDGMLPEIGGYPQAPGVEWLFKSGSRTFLAEAYIDNTEPAFLLFELDKDGAYVEKGELPGTYDHADGYISILVPLKTIGAKRGTKISGGGENDVDTHVHHATTTSTDTLTTSGSFRVR